MAEFKNKNKNSFWYSPLVLVILFLLLIFFIYKVANLIKKDKETSEKKEMTLEKIDELKERERILNEDINKIKTEEGIEETIREKYQVVKEGEKMVIIVDEESNPSSGDEKDVDHSFLTWLKNLFKN